MASSAELIEQQKMRLLAIVDGEMSKLAKLSNKDNLLDRDERAMLETMARLLKQLQGEVSEDERTPGHLSPAQIAATLRPTAP